MGLKRFPIHPVGKATAVVGDENQAFLHGSALEGEDALNREAVLRIAAKAVDGFGRVGDNAARRDESAKLPEPEGA